jgi:hypothetical protein
MPYVTPDWVKAVQDSAVVLGFLIALIGGLVAVGRVMIVKPLKRLIEESTRQIQPEANGGKSLADLHVKVDGLGTRLSRVERELLRIDEELDEIVSD